MARIDVLTAICRLAQMALSAAVAGLCFSRSSRILQNAAWAALDVLILGGFALLAVHVRRDGCHDSRLNLLVLAMDAVAFVFSLTAPSLVASTSGGHWNVAPVTIGYFCAGLMLFTLGRDVQQLRVVHVCAASDLEKERHAPPEYCQEGDGLPNGDNKLDGDSKVNGKIKLDT